MASLEFYAVLFVALAVGGCFGVANSDQPATRQPSGRPDEANPVASQPSVAINQPDSALTKPGVGASQAAKYFPNLLDARLADALQRSDWAEAEKALSAGADVNAIGNEQIYPLAWTMYVKNKAAFEWLLGHGADPNSDVGEDGSVLFWAAKADVSDWLRMLLAHKANPNLKHKSSIGITETPLFAAVGICALENEKLLIAAGADINYRTPDQDGASTPAINAATVGFFKGVYVLLEAGADIRPRTTGGSDLTYFVARYRIGPDDDRYLWREKVLNLLRKKGADVDAAFKAVSDAEAKDRKDNPWRYR